MTPSGAVLRRVPETDIMVHPFAVDGSVFGWASGVEETARILDTLVDLGGNLISTADHYAGGRSEIMIGSWLAKASNRAKAVILTKIGRHPDAQGLSTRNVISATERSLQRLNTDHLDFLTLDGVDASTPIDETLEAVDLLKRAGKVRWLAVSGYPASSIEQIDELASSAVYPRIRLVSTAYNLMHRGEFEGDLARVSGTLGIGVVARLPLASGFLSGDFRSKSDEPSSPLFEDALKHVGKHGTKVLGALQEVAEAHGCSIGQVALAWVLSKPGIAAAGIRVKSADQLIALAAPGELVLSRHDVAALDRASAR